MILLAQSTNAENAKLFDLSDRGLLLSDGVFDTSLVTEGEIHFKEAHLARLKTDAEALGITWPEVTIASHCEAIENSKLSGALRITLTRGPGKRGVNVSSSATPTIIANLTEFDRAVQCQPLRLQTSEIRRNETSPTSRRKTLAYLDNLVAGQMAREAGFDDALFLNSIGNVCCATVGNLFVQSEGTLFTPPVADGVLPGIMRQCIMKIAPDLGFQVAERSLSVDDVMACDRVFVTNSLRLACPISQIDEKDFPDDLPSEMETALRAQFGNPS